MTQSADSPFLMTRKISLRLDVSLADRLQDRADRERVPLSYVLRHLVLRFLEEPQGTARPASPALRAGSAAAVTVQVERQRAEFETEVCTLFDALRGEGVEPKEAAKRVNFALKARNHPWASFDVVSGILRAHGRFRKTAGKRKGRP